MSLVDEVCACGKIKSLMNSINWQRHTKSCKKRKSVLPTVKLSTFFKSSRVSIDSDKAESPILETIESVSEQHISDFRANEDFTDSCLSTEKQDKWCTTSTVPKDIIEVSSVSTTAENISGSNVENYLNSISTVFENYPNDPALIPTSNISDKQFSFINSLGPCQPLQSSLPGVQFPKKNARRKIEVIIKHWVE